MLKVLHISHPWGGGILTYIQDLQQAAAGEYRIFVLTCWEGVATLTEGVGEQRLEKRYPVGRNFAIGDYASRDYARVLARILAEHDIDIVHVDSHIGHTFDIYPVAARYNLPLVVVVHDFFYICPSIHLVRNNGEFCQLCFDGSEDLDCIRNHRYLYSGFDPAQLRTFRNRFRAVLPQIDTLVFPSCSAKELFQSYYGIAEEKCRVIGHGTPLVRSAPPTTASAGPLRVGILGTMYEHKGKGVIQAVIDKLAEADVEFYHFGEGELAGRKLISLGGYERRTIIEQLAERRIDVILLLSTWPETFSYTLTEAVAANIPPIVSSLGALGERVAAEELGWVVDCRDVAGISALLVRLAAHRDEVHACRERVATAKLKTLREMRREYMQLYQELRLAHGAKRLPGGPAWQAIILFDKLAIPARISRIKAGILGTKLLKKLQRP